MTNFLSAIEAKINDKLNPEKLQLIDNSYLHKKHKSFDPKKLHLKIIIKSITLKKMKKIEAHKMIFSILDDEMKNKIHALEIEIQ
tara:strand:+ start:537 stop:791 length:255 start_codon:yes stop_codon:yes gene_type:complete